MENFKFILKHKKGHGKNCTISWPTELIKGPKCVTKTPIGLATFVTAYLINYKKNFKAFYICLVATGDLKNELWQGASL